MIDECVNPLGRIILILSARETAYGTEKYRKRNVRIKMMRTDECSLDICGFVFVFHVVEGRQNCHFQRFFVIGNKNVVNTLLFLHKGSAPVLTFLISEGVIHGLLQFCVFHIFNLLCPLCFFIKSIIYARFHKFLYTLNDQRSYEAVLCTYEDEARL